MANLDQPLYFDLQKFLEEEPDMPPAGPDLSWLTDEYWLDMFWPTVTPLPASSDSDLQPDAESNQTKHNISELYAPPPHSYLGLKLNCRTIEWEA
jgi:hypothetical protein